MDIYLEHCNAFAKNNLKKDKIEVLPFEIKAHLVKATLMEKGELPLFSPLIVADLASESDEKVSSHFAIIRQRLFKNVFYLKGEMYLIVKSWERVKYTEQTKESSDDEQSSPDKNEEGAEADDDNPVFSKRDFFIKTIRCYDKFYKIKNEIFVEQVFGIFDNFRLYDVSMCQFKDHLYYYKRHHISEGKSKLCLYKLHLGSYKE